MPAMAFAEAFPMPTWQQWRHAVEGVLKGAGFEDALVGRSADGFEIQPLYAKAAGAIVMGRRPGMPWHVTARVDQPDGDAAAVSALVELEGGATSLALVMQGSRFARGHGVAAASPAELDAALAGVDLGLVHLWLDPGRGARDAELLAAMVAGRGLAPEGLDLDFGIDPLGEAVATGQVPAGAGTLGASLAATFDGLRGQGFKGPLFRADGRAYHEAGASEAQELACVLATLVAHLRGLDACGIGLEAARGSLSVAMAADADQLLTIAKFRALRRLWDHIQRACGMAPAPIALHAETSWRMLTQRDPWTNILRCTIATLSAGVAGADSIAVLAFDHALGLSHESARRISRNTQLILQHEAQIWRVVDPAAGSGGIEAMTDALCQSGWLLFQQIERGGGMLRALANGDIGRMLQPSRQALQAAVATCARMITGTSAFPNLREQRIERPCGSRDSCGDVSFEAAGSGPLLPSFRLSEGFERMRDRSERAVATAGAPRVFVACLGERKPVAGQSAFAETLFATGGITTIVEGDLGWEGGDTAGQVVTRWRASGASLVCLCISDELAMSAPDDATYPGDTLAEEICRRLRQAGAGLIAYAGNPQIKETALLAAGVSHFLQPGCDVLAVLDAGLTAHTDGSQP